MEENEELHEFERHARHQLREARRIEKQRDRALEASHALTNKHTYEAEYLISHKQMHCIPVEYRVHMGKLLEIAGLEASTSSGNAQAAVRSVHKEA